MEVVQTNTGAAIAARRRYFPAISWGGIVAGIIVGLAIQLVLTLLGIAAGLTAFGLGATPPTGEVPAWVGAWQSVSVLIAAFVGGYVAARMSGLQRKGDGMLHGLVAWGATTLIVALLTTSAIGALFGRGPAAALSSFGGNGAATQAQANGNPELGARLDELVRNATAQSTLDAQTTAQTMRQLQRHVLAGERAPAIDLLVRTTGMPPDQATAIVDDALAFVRAPLAAPANGETAEAAGVMSWWMFGAAVLSMLLGIVGGLAGAAGTRRMRSADERMDRMVSA